MRVSELTRLGQQDGTGAVSEREAEGPEALSPSASILIPLILGSAILCVAAVASYRYVESREEERARTHLGEARDALKQCLDMMEKRRYADAERLSTQAIELVPDLHTAYFFRGKARMALKKNEEAVSDFTRGIELNPNPKDTYYDYYHRGLVLYRLHMDPQAERDFTEALQLQKHSAQAYRARALARQRMGDQTGYEEDVQQALKLGTQVEP